MGLIGKSLSRVSFFLSRSLSGRDETFGDRIPNGVNFILEIGILAMFGEFLVNSWKSSGL